MLIPHRLRLVVLPILLAAAWSAAGGTPQGPAQPATNYDESKVPAYTLPPLLVKQNGDRVQRAADWAVRREEIRLVLESQMFGRAPRETGAVQYSKTDEGPALAGQAVRRQVTITVAGRQLHLLLYLPAKVARPVPVFVGLGFQPNQSVHRDPGIRLAGTWVRNSTTQAIELKPADESTRGAASSRWPVEAILSRGYGLATMYYGDIEPDHDGARSLGIRHGFSKPGQPPPGDDGWGAIAAWAWGLSRIADYLNQDKDVDASRLIVVGHSRLGKAALWAGAQDPRFAIVISNDSGEGGAAISRRRFGETVADLNTRFPHWFCGKYQQHSGGEDQMPFDAHMLLALAAPRPLYVASAADDLWADPKGEFLGAVAASEVYALLGRTGLGTSEMPPPDRPVGDTVRYHVRTGKHDITLYDWQQFLDFADRHLATRGRTGPLQDGAGGPVQAPNRRGW